MSNSRPSTNQTEQGSKATATEDKQPLVSTTHMLVRESLRIGIVGTGVAGALFPLDLLLQKSHIKAPSSSPESTHRPTSEPPKSQASLSGSPRSSFTGFTFAAAQLLGKSLMASTKSSIIKNAALSQRTKLLNDPKLPNNKGEIEPRPEEYEQESNSGSSLSLKQIVGVSAIIGLADTTFTQWHSNQRVWLVHQYSEHREKRSFTPPKPTCLQDYFKIGASGYPLRLSRNVVLVSGLLTTGILQQELNYTSLSPNQNRAASAIISGALAGVGSNALDVLYKNQAIRIDPTSLHTPSAVTVGKDLITQNGPKVLMRGFGVSVIYTIVAYSVVPYMEEAAKTAIPAIEKTTAYCTQFFANFFSSGKTAKPTLTSAKPSEPTPSTDPSTPKPGR